MGRGSIGRGNPNPKKVDSLGRKRLNPEDYSQSGGTYYLRHIVWRCKVCSRAWNVSTKSKRYDSKCRQCGTRNSISLVRKKTYSNTRKRITKFEQFSTPGDAAFEASRLNYIWMQRKIPFSLRSREFVRASLHNKPQGSIDEKGHSYPKTKEMAD